MSPTQSYRDATRLLITRIMSGVPVSASKEHLEILLRNAMPQYRSPLSIEAWNLEKNIAVAEWNQDLPGVASTQPCAGGPLISTPISCAVPEPLPSKNFKQQPLL